MPQSNRDARAHAWSVCHTPNCCPGFCDLPVGVLLDLALGKICSSRAQATPRQARTSDDRLASFWRVDEAQLQGARAACLNPENSHLGCPTEFIIGGSWGTQNASSGSYHSCLECVQAYRKLGNPLRSVCLQNPDPCSLPVEFPFLSRRRSSSTLIDSCKSSPSDKHPSGIVQAISAGTLQDHARSRRDISAAQHPGHYEPPQHKASASWESSRCGVPSVVVDKMQRHSTTTISLNDAADTQKWVPKASGHYPKRAASQDSNKVRVQSLLPVDHSKKSSRPKRQDDTQPVRMTSAPQIAMHNSVTMHYVSSGTLICYYHYIWHMSGHWNLFVESLLSGPEQRYCVCQAIHYLFLKLLPWNFRWSLCAIDNWISLW